MLETPPFSVQITISLDELVRKQQASQDGKPRQGALYFVSFSIPEEGLKRMLGETRHYGIPATLRGHGEQ